MEIITGIIFIAFIAYHLLNWMEKRPSTNLFVANNPEKVDYNENSRDDIPHRGVAVSTTRMDGISQQLTAFLNKKNFKYTVSEEGSLYTMTFYEEEAVVDILIRIDKKASYLCFNSTIYRDVQDNSLIKVTELLARLNETFVLGHLNMHYDSRVISFEGIIILYNTVLTDDLLDLYLHHTINAAIKYPPLFNRVIEQGEEPLIVMIDFFSAPEIQNNNESGEML